ncbi:hypothetical protein FBU30_003569 [Linnemannia zychae]|nr:hypothetical protein FBU30_003569 [Linnemannia zychae]
MTLAWGPLQKSHQFGSAGYTQGANVILVSPETPQAYYAHGGGAYYPQMAQQQPQQPVLLNYQNSNYKVDENPYLQQQPYPVLYQQPQQQQPYPPSPQSNTQPSPQQRHSFQQQPSPQPYPQYSPQPQPQPSPGGYISQADHLG